MTKPFEKEEELAEKLDRLSALNALLNMDEKGAPIVDIETEDLEADCDDKSSSKPTSPSRTAASPSRITDRPSIANRLHELQDKLKSTDSSLPQKHRELAI